MLLSEIVNIPQIPKHFRLCRSEFKPPTRSSQDIKGLSGHGKAVLERCKVTKLRIINSRSFKHKNVGKFTCNESKEATVVDNLLIDYVSVNSNWVHPPGQPPGIRSKKLPGRSGFDFFGPGFCGKLKPC